MNQNSSYAADQPPAGRYSNHRPYAPVSNMEPSPPKRAVSNTSGNNYGVNDDLQSVDLEETRS